MSTPEYVCKLLIKQREEQMNTIQITTEDGTVNYTENEVLRYIERAKEVDAVQQVSNEYRTNLTTVRRIVRDFFSEGEWCDGDITFNKPDVNEMLNSIGANILTTKYTATFTITGTFEVECEDEDDAETIFTDNVNVEFYDGSVDVDQIDVHDIEVNE
jgi:hypothetical protein